MRVFGSNWPPHILFSSTLMSRGLFSYQNWNQITQSFPKWFLTFVMHPHHLLHAKKWPHVDDTGDTSGHMAFKMPWLRAWSPRWGTPHHALPALPEHRAAPGHPPKGLSLLGYCPINIRNDDLVIPVPQVNGPCTATGALILGCNTKHNIIWAIMELQFCLFKKHKNKENQLKTYSLKWFKILQNNNWCLRIPARGRMLSVVLDTVHPVPGTANNTEGATAWTVFWGSKDFSEPPQSKRSTTLLP